MYYQPGWENGDEPGTSYPGRPAGIVLFVWSFLWPYAWPPERTRSPSLPRADRRRVVSSNVVVIDPLPWSGSWPVSCELRHIKLLSMHLAYYLPLPTGLRRNIFFWLAIFGKWSLIDPLIS
jgi:hypothetical protein